MTIARAVVAPLALAAMFGSGFGADHGSSVPGSHRTLASGLGPKGEVAWDLVQYDTTTFRCTRLVFSPVPNGRVIGSGGHCGSDDSSAPLPVTSGGVRDEYRNRWHSGAFGLRVPPGTAVVEVALSTGVVVRSVPAASGVWVAVWDEPAAIVHVTAIGADGEPIHRCTEDCAS